MAETGARCAIEYDSVPPSLWLARRRRKAEDLVPGRSHEYFALGRSALLWLCRSLGWGPGDRILMPAYTCESVSDPFLAAGMTLDFYGINPDLSVDLADLERRLPGARGGVLIHYFGWLQPLVVRRWLASRSPEHGFWIEDLTHSLFTQPADDSFETSGDAVLVSYRKLFPCADGCVLALRDRTPSTVPSREGRRRYAVHGALRYGRMALTGVLGGGRRKRGRLVRRFDTALRDLRIHPPIEAAPMHPLSRHIVERFDVDRSRMSRRANAHELLTALDRVTGVVPLFTDLGTGIVPGLLPIRVLGGRRDDVRDYLDERGIEAHFHWRRPPGLRLGEHPASDQLREEELSLPLDERYGAEDMRNIARLIRASLAHATVPKATRKGDVQHAIPG